MTAHAESLLITPSLAETSVSAASEAIARRDQLLADAANVTTITDRLDADAALPALRQITEYLDFIEARRIAAKAPALEIGRKIDALARDLCGALRTQADRIGKLLGAFESEERRKADEARRAAEAEAARIAYEATMAEKKAVAAARTDEAAARASDAIIGEAQTKIAEVRATAAAVAPPRVAGVQVRENIVFEVNDVKALYAARPDLVTLEPNGAAIRAILRANPDVVLPGVTHRREAKLSAR